MSVLEQDFRAAETEIIVVDDGSVDRTPEILRRFEPRVRLLRKANGGQASEFNAGIPETTADSGGVSNRAEVARLKLILNGGWSWETFRAESLNFRLNYRDADWGYRLFKGFVLLLTLLVPPRTFYRIRRWYSEHNLRQVREKLGKASLTVPQVVEDAVHKAAQR